MYIVGIGIKKKIKNINNYFISKKILYDNNFLKKIKLNKKEYLNYFKKKIYINSYKLLYL
ncbi:MAG: hypothetical protein NHG07_01005 [Candidatus Shikimatogenerans bostrichidophilus]|nr:MAG: hypothetical protein NHG07_01005 [Candidatus Shikimatogenerans bostrichidophilus]